MTDFLKKYGHYFGALIAILCILNGVYHWIPDNEAANKIGAILGSLIALTNPSILKDVNGPAAPLFVAPVLLAIAGAPVQAQQARAPT